MDQRLINQTWIMIDGAVVVCYNMAMIDISAGCPEEGELNMLIHPVK